VSVHDEPESFLIRLNLIMAQKLKAFDVGHHQHRSLSSRPRHRSRPEGKKGERAGKLCYHFIFA